MVVLLVFFLGILLVALLASDFVSSLLVFLLGKYDTYVHVG